MVSDWHILPILETSFVSFLVHVQSRSRKIFLNELLRRLALNFSTRQLKEQQTKTINR